MKISQKSVIEYFAALKFIFLARVFALKARHFSLNCVSTCISLLFALATFESNMSRAS